MAKPVRVAVLGAGLFASQAHMPGIKAHPDAELIALYSRNKDHAAQIAERVGGVPLITDDLAGLLGRSDLDAVTVASSDDNHYHYTMAALKAGKHVFCEKPLAVTAARAREMAAEATARNLINQVAFIFRYTYCVQELQRLVKAGHLGQVHWMTANWDGFANVVARRRFTWRNVGDVHGGGELAELGSHFFDSVNWIVGQISEVAALTYEIPRTVVDEQGHEHAQHSLDLASVLLRTANGSQGQAITSRITPETNGGAYIQVSGEQGALWASMTRGQGEFLRFMKPGGQWEDIKLPDAAYDKQPHAMFRMLGSFIDAVQRGHIDPAADANFVAGYTVQSAIDQAILSATSKRFEPVAQGL